MLFDHVSYPTPPLPSLAAVFLEGFHANEACRSHDADTGKEIDDLSYQRNCALWEGGRQRVLECGSVNHADHAAKVLVIVDELDRFLEGHYSIGAALSLDDDERDALRKVREGAVSLLRFHFENGAGALIPVARDLGLVHGWTSPAHVERAA